MGVLTEVVNTNARVRTPLRRRWLFKRNYIRKQTKLHSQNKNKKTCLSPGYRVGCYKWMVLSPLKHFSRFGAMMGGLGPGYPTWTIYWKHISTTLTSLSHA
jgi:hypothetical protein